jgi:hypothetical protein
MGVVYRAWHQAFKKWVALKVLAPTRVTNPQTVARFEREREIAGKLIHPNIVRATDADDVDGVWFLVMDLIEGADLGLLVREVGKLPVPEACELVRQAAVGLQYAHENGLVHRDLKPSNLMLASGGEVKILDLGLALLRGDVSEEPLTADGQMMGTADYMAPEQWQMAHEVDIRADIYSLGCTLYTLLTGRPPFAGPQYVSYGQKLAAHLSAVPRPVTEIRGDVPPELLALLGRMLAKEPADRPQTPGDLARELEPFVGGANLARLCRSLPVTPVPPTPASAEHPSTRDAPERTVAETGRPRRIGWLLWGSVAAVVLLGLLLPWWGSSPRERVMTPGRWADLLDRPPTELVWWNPRGDGHYALNAAAGTLNVTTASTALLSLGRTNATRYKLQVGLRQGGWPGGCGVFFGGQRSDDGKELRCQTLRFEPRMGPKQEPAVCRGAGSVQFRPAGAPAIVLDALKFNPVRPPEGREHYLEFNVTPGGIDLITWDTNPCPALTVKEINGLFKTTDYQGEFGVLCQGGAVSVLHARFMPLE